MSAQQAEHGIIPVIIPGLTQVYVPKSPPIRTFGSKHRIIDNNIITFLYIFFSLTHI